jgi:hypothetical protein
MSYVLNYLITPDTRREHRPRWFVYAGPYGEKIPHTAEMRGQGIGWDVTCSSGWESHTGGATRGSVESDLWDHRYAAQGQKDSEADQR